MKGKGIISHFPTWYNKMKKLNCKEVNEALKKGNHGKLQGRRRILHI